MAGILFNSSLNLYLLSIGISTSFSAAPRLPVIKQHPHRTASRGNLSFPGWLPKSIYSLELAFFKALHGKIITQRNNNWKVICDERGWHDVPGEVRADDWDDVVKAKGLVKVQTGSFDNVELNHSYLKEMAEFCQKRNIQLVLVTIPTSEVYNSLLDSMRVKTTYAQVSRIQKEFGSVYLDYREDNRFTSDDFADANHLNPLGAEKFTKLLMTDMLTKGN